MSWPLESTYASLPPRLFARVPPTPVQKPRLVKVNASLAELLGLDVEELASPAGVDVLAGNAIPEGAVPIALAYAGHQFGSFVRLGDGRAILLGEIVGRDGVRRDVQLKGAGPTPFSRQGDGRAALGPVLREYIVSEAMAALGVPTTRALAAVTTGELVYREQPLPGAILTRVAASHIRVGTFELLSALGDREALTALTGYALARHYPDAATADAPARALLDSVIQAQASLVARWLGLGFVHGVMNTDNTSISGETIDYGPCAFLDEYDPRKTFSSIDRGGRYAYANQPRIAGWNLARLAESLLPLLDADEEEAVRVATEHIERFAPRFEAAYAAVLRAKIGLAATEEGDLALAQDLLGIVAESAADFTLFFRDLCDAAADPAADAKVASRLEDPERFHAWARTWRARLAREQQTAGERADSMRRANPAFIPRNHRVEEAIRAAVQSDDFEPFETLVRVLARPYDAQPEHEHLAAAPKTEERVLQTFCGT